jgi:hypothetical protein
VIDRSSSLEVGSEGEVPRCATCGTALGDDVEDEPFGDAGRPICGECNRSRNFDVDLEFELDADDAD